MVTKFSILDETVYGGANDSSLLRAQNNLRIVRLVASLYWAN